MKRNLRPRSRMLSRILGFRRLGKPRKHEVRQFGPREQDTNSQGATIGILSSKESQLDLFGLVDVIEIYSGKPKFNRRTKKTKKKRSHVKKGLQYKIELRVRKTERQVEYRPKDNTDHRLSNTEADTWSPQGLVKLYQALLTESISTAKRRDDLSWSSHAEIWLWIERRDTADPFSFIRCCEYSNVDPDILRPMLKRLLNHNTPHIDLLRRSIKAAEAGDPDAIEWCLSDDDGPLTFTDACRAAGFQVNKARTELRLPVPAASTPACDESIAA